MDRDQGWASEQTASAYAEFTDEHQMYRRTSEDLVGRLNLSADSRVVDLCAGTGATTAALLRSLGSAGSVCAVDASEAMLSQARERIDDDRVTWVLGAAEDAAELLLGPVDAIVCNSAIWQTDLPRTAAAVAALLRPGGRFACNIGRGFLIMPFTEQELDRRAPSLVELMSAFAVLDLGFVPPVGSGPRGRPLTPDGVAGILDQAGLSADAPQVVTLDRTAAEDEAWLRVPIFTERLFPGLSYDARMTLLDKALAHGTAEPVETSTWVVFTATRR